MNVLSEGFLHSGHTHQSLRSRGETNVLSNAFLTWNQLRGASGTFKIHNNEHISLIHTADKE